MWDARSGQRLGELALKGQPLAFIKSGGMPLVVTRSFDQTVQLWDVHADRPLGEPLTGHGGLVTAVALGEVDGKPILASGGVDKTVRLWDARSGKPLGEPLKGHETPVTAVTFGKIDEKSVVVSVDENNTTRLWDVRTGLSLGKPLTGSHVDQITGITLFNVDGIPMIASSSTDHNVRLWDVQSGRRVGELMWYEEVVDMERSEVTEAVEVKGLSDDEWVALAKRGDREAQLQLYFNRGGIEGLTWLCRAADLAQAEARYRLGLLYENGSKTVPKDYVKAYQWYMLGAAVGDYWSAEAAQRIGRNLTLEQMAQGERLIIKWHPGQCETQVRVKKYGLDRALNKRKCTP